MMKEITGYVGKVLAYGSTWTCRITDQEAMHECLLAEMVGWSAEDAVRKFNKRLAHFGYEITKMEKDILRY